MKKISLSVVVSIIKMVVAALQGVLVLARKIADLVDNGKVDESYQPPHWMLNVESGLRYVSDALACFQCAGELAFADECTVVDDDHA